MSVQKWELYVCRSSVIKFSPSRSKDEFLQQARLNWIHMASSWRNLKYLHIHVAPNVCVCVRLKRVHWKWKENERRWREIACGVTINWFNNNSHACFSFIYVTLQVVVEKKRGSQEMECWIYCLIGDLSSSWDHLDFFFEKKGEKLADRWKLPYRVLCNYCF